MDLPSWASCLQPARSLFLGVKSRPFIMGTPIVFHAGVELKLSSPPNPDGSGSEDDECVVWLFCYCPFFRMT